MKRYILIPKRSAGVESEILEALTSLKNTPKAALEEATVDAAWDSEDVYLYSVTIERVKKPRKK